MIVVDRSTLLTILILAAGVVVLEVLKSGAVGAIRGAVSSPGGEH